MIWITQRLIALLNIMDSRLRIHKEFIAMKPHYWSLMVIMLLIVLAILSIISKFIISDTSSPVTPNPRIEHSTECPDPSLRLLWSPPYLWSGKYIDYFKISIIRKNDGRVLYTERVERLIDHEIESMCICQALNYSEGFFFEIKAYTVNRDMHIMLLNGTGNFNETEEFPSGEN